MYASEGHFDKALRRFVVVLAAWAMFFE